MPTYVYECSSCSSTFEVEQRITEDPLSSCRCGSTGTVKRLIQPIAVMFKGSGFHINDYSGASKTEAKPETKTETPACTGEPSSCGCSTAPN
jgi:putative FmdB family regulatory protein